MGDIVQGNRKSLKSGNPISGGLFTVCREVRKLRGSGWVVLNVRHDHRETMTKVETMAKIMAELRAEGIACEVIHSEINCRGLSWEDTERAEKIMDKYGWMNATAAGERARARDRMKKSRRQGT